MKDVFKIIKNQRMIISGLTKPFDFFVYVLEKFKIQVVIFSFNWVFGEILKGNSCAKVCYIFFVCMIIIFVTVRKCKTSKYRLIVLNIY